VRRVGVVITVVVVVALVALAAAWVARRMFRRVTVYEFERGLRYVNGRFKDVLEPGRYWVYRPAVWVNTIDIRPQVVLVPGQEVVTSDGLQLKSVELKDLMFPGALKRIFAQVVEARQQGLAALEKARGETAALRNLANAARLVEAAPALLQLRLLQQIAASTGNTIVFGLPSSNTPLPIRGDTDPQRTELEPPPSEE
jgi:regulator of protease activity HflC (stomatin/prohibitin superfamily)